MAQQNPYTYTGNILTSVNPCIALPDMYSVERMRSYAGKRIGAGQPHLYGIGEEAFRKLLVSGVSQGIVVSGVSGAGKTVSSLPSTWPPQEFPPPSPRPNCARSS